LSAGLGLHPRLPRGAGPERPLAELHEKERLGFHAIARLLEADRCRAQGVPYARSAFRPTFYTEARCRHYYRAWKRIITWEGLDKAQDSAPKPAQ
jgi:hypothetical protein